MLCRRIEASVLAFILLSFHFIRDCSYLERGGQALDLVGLGSMGHGDNLATDSLLLLLRFSEIDRDRCGDWALLRTHTLDFSRKRVEWECGRVGKTYFGEDSKSIGSVSMVDRVHLYFFGTKNCTEHTSTERDHVPLHEAKKALEGALLARGTLLGEE